MRNKISRAFGGTVSFTLEERITVPSMAVKSATIQGDWKELLKPQLYHLYILFQGLVEIE